MLCISWTGEEEKSSERRSRVHSSSVFGLPYIQYIYISISTHTDKDKDEREVRSGRSRRRIKVRNRDDKGGTVVTVVGRTFNWTRGKFLSDNIFFSFVSMALERIKPC